MRLDLITRPIVWICPVAWFLDLMKTPQAEEATAQPQRAPLENQDQIEAATAQPQYILSDNQDLDPTSKMPQNPPKTQTNASGGDRKMVGNHTNGRHEGHPRPVSGTGSQQYYAEHRSGREDSSQSRFRAQAAHLKRIERNYEQLVDEHGSLQHNYTKLYQAHQTTIADLRETQVACNGQQQEIKMLREKLRGASALSDVRNQELKVARTFLSKGDLFSTSDVVQLVRDLNSEIMQIAAHLVETLPLKRFCTPSAQGVPEGWYNYIFSTLVVPQGPGEEVDKGSLELALQGFLALYAHAVTNAWSFSHGSDWCDTLYSKVCEIEDWTVASNWRVLSRRALGHMDLSHENLPRAIANDAVQHLADLLSFRGVGNPIDNVTNIKKHGAEKLETLFTAARKLNTMIGQNIVSEELAVTVVPCGTLFEGEFMEDTHARVGVKPARRTVICTTDLGLWGRKQAKEVMKVLSKPKVATW